MIFCPLVTRSLSTRAALVVLTSGLCSVLASASTIEDYSITLSLNSGPLAGQTGYGTMSIDDSFAQVGSGFTVVEPGGGLLSLQMTFLGTILSSATAVNYPTLPVIFLDNTTLAPIGIWAEWGNTSTTPGPAFLFLNFGSVEYDTLLDSLYIWERTANRARVAHRYRKPAELWNGHHYGYPGTRDVPAGDGEFGPRYLEPSEVEMANVGRWRAKACFRQSPVRKSD